MIDVVAAQVLPVSSDPGTISVFGSVAGYQC
jgi:hypothetical protein